MAFRIHRRKDINAIRVAMKIVATIISLWVGGFAYNIVALILNNTNSPFYKGLKLVGFNVIDATNASVDYCHSNSCWIDVCPTNISCATRMSCPTLNNCVNGTSSTSLLAIIGILAVIWVAFEFIEVKF